MAVGCGQHDFEGDDTVAVDARKERFEKALIDGREVLFTNLRIDRSTVPETLLCYDIRETDGFSGVAASVERHVLVNHWGTILSKEPFPLESGRYEIEADDIEYLDEFCGVVEYMGKESRA